LYQRSKMVIPMIVQLFHDLWREFKLYGHMPILSDIVIHFHQNRNSCPLSV
jgi:hypothetical protein